MRIAELNRAQLEAVQAAEGPFVLLAGPGTGKTRTFAHRVAYLIQEKGVPLENILALTFTRSAAGEMRERLKALLGWEPKGLWIETFHAAALRILREHGYPFGPGIEFSVAEEGDPENRVLSFDDVLACALRLLGERPKVLEAYRRRFLHVLVDEFQDTSPAQYELLRLLAGQNVCVIGDPDQAIYGFAGEDFKPFERFKRDWGHRVLSLCENYRSKPAILEAAKQVIGKNRAQLPRQLEARLEGGLPVEILPHASERQEAEMIARKIEGLLGGASSFTIDSRWAEKEEESYAYGLADIAILYRFHAQAGALKKALERLGLPCRVFGKPSPEEDLRDFVSGEEVPGEAITLMTLHRSKGREFPIVFLAGLEEGVLPFGRAELEEERRLFYVGMTRAKSRLFLSYAKKRFLFGEMLSAGPSPFVSDIEEELRVLRENPPGKRRPKDNQLSLFKAT